jgi:hypothetical protein
MSSLYARARQSVGEKCPAVAKISHRSLCQARRVIVSLVDDPELPDRDLPRVSILSVRVPSGRAEGVLWLGAGSLRHLEDVVNFTGPGSTADTCRAEVIRFVQMVKPVRAWCHSRCHAANTRPEHLHTE